MREDACAARKIRLSGGLIQSALSACRMASRMRFHYSTLKPNNNLNPICPEASVARGEREPVRKSHDSHGVACGSPTDAATPSFSSISN
jgi:hypothetical protein